VGWWGTAVLLTALIQPKNLPTKPLLIIYTITWFLETFGLLFFWDLIGPGLVGGAVMGLCRRCWGSVTPILNCSC
jgi:putative membrane protein